MLPLHALGCRMNAMGMDCHEAIVGETVRFAKSVALGLSTRVSDQEQKRPEIEMDLPLPYKSEAQKKLWLDVTVRNSFSRATMMQGDPLETAKKMKPGV